MKKGFTLIELLAVIVILAIIALIAVPIVINIINDSKEESIKRNIQNYLDIVVTSITKENLKIKYNPDECVIQENGNVICSENGNELNTSNGTKELNIEMNGTKLTTGIIKVKEGKVVDIINIFLNGKYYNFDSSKKIVSSDILKAGLYDENDNMLATWDDLIMKYHLNIEQDYPNSTYSQKDSGSMYDILNNNDELKNAKKIIINDTVTNIGYGAFYYCEALTDIIIPDSVIIIKSNAFYGCNNLKNIKLSNKITKIFSWTFAYCTNLKNIVFPDSLTNIDDYAFNSCAKLESLVIPSKVLNIGQYAFIWCPNIKTIKVDNKNTIIPDGVTSIGFNAFCGTSITNVTIPSSVKTIEGFAFYGCNNLTDVIILKGTISIGRYAFADSVNLMNVTIPDSVVSIEQLAFYNCRKLSSITIPSSVTSIEYGAFGGCNNLISVTFENTQDWYITDSFNTEHVDIDVTNLETNATNLKSTYYDKWWKRSQS